MMRGKTYKKSQIMAYKKYDGIDSRRIKCADDSDGTIEAGLSMDTDNGTPVLCFHYLERMRVGWGKPNIIIEKTKTMHLNDVVITDIIQMLEGYITGIIE
jgi:hypothetical protein